MKKNTIVAVLTIMALLVGINMCTFVSLADSGEIRVIFGNVKAQPGDRIEVPVSIENAPAIGIVNIDFEVGYDSKTFDVIDVKPGDIVENASNSFDYYILEEGDSIAILYSEDTGRGTEAIKKDGVFFTIVLDVKKDAQPGISPIKKLSFGGTADNDLNEIYTEFITGQVEIIEAAAPTATPTPKPTETAKPTTSSTPESTSGGGTGGSGGQTQNTPKPTESVQPTATPKATEEPIEDMPQTGAVGKHTPFLKGYPGGLFKPENNITRAEAAVIFAKLLGADENSAGKNSSIAFDDLKDSHWAAWAIKYVAEENLFGGYPDGTFMPDKSITRAEFATVAYKFLEKLGKIEEVQDIEIQLKDIDGHWAQKYIKTLVAKGYIKGYPDETFRPQASIKRSESVALINRSLERGPLNGAVLDFQDVPANYWAYKDIAEGVIYHSYKIDENGQEVMVEKLD
ncbi:S-layer homology domain-containing protein [Acetivibrio mesophilus]|uniref:Cellulosome anchor protein n=1 Tax=Acetivibrio mesophilus TaxID=2487273 RepID=A0A4Q0I147_9FIRM|nr:S-layer homology domain-containing protein [Acetivibrio mesophilus]ODM27876.1 cellulosome anchor protein [Clostridium sp. Bc-iso-3]RXE57908.1 cellulosome anchor protein [Acetivibrio mesophilus]HHV28733.1 cellulosome anchor protein [Clostridium sp.]